jgi:quinoprotein dehydrogenase-associated probable ABC transporter substrate-binding protein
MFSRSRRRVVLALVLALPAASRSLRVCADPNNLPFSNQQQEGFENRVAEILAHEIGATVEYTWFSERRAFVKNTLNDNRCDVLIGIPTALETVSVTEPYFTSTYVFVTRRDRNLNITSIRDPRLVRLRLGVHMTGEDYAPPANALALLGAATNVKGYRLFGPLGEANPPARIIEAVESREIDVAIVWGPFAGYFAPRANSALTITPIAERSYRDIPFAYAISVAVRKGNDALKAELDRVLKRSCPAVQSILREYGVPQVRDQGGGDACASSPSSASAH